MATLKTPGSYAQNLARIQAKKEATSIKNVASLVAEKKAAQPAVVPTKPAPKVPAVSK